LIVRSAESASNVLIIENLDFESEVLLQLFKLYLELSLL
jgi:hypothetical protein